MGGGTYGSATHQVLSRLAKKTGRTVVCDTTNVCQIRDDTGVCCLVHVDELAGELGSLGHGDFSWLPDP
jgi:hypothetical protein